MNQDCQSLKEKLTSCLQELGLYAQILKQCEQRTVTFSALYDANQNEASAGSGNGENSEEKSWAECIEHYFYLHSQCEPRLSSIQELMAQPGFVRDGALPTLDPKRQISTTIFEKMENLQEHLQVPLDYVSRQNLPDSEKALRLFLSSSGYSFHQSRQGALSHGLLEVIERHEFSNALLGRQTSFQIECASLPAQMRESVSRLESHFLGEIRIFAIDPQFQVWTTFVVFYPNHPAFPLPQTSQKTRPGLLSSIEGALSEMKQILHLYSDDERQEDLAVLENRQLQNHPSIHLRDFHQSPWMDSHFFDLHSRSFETQEASLSDLVRSVRFRGFEPYCRTVFEFQNGCHVTQVFVPGFEKFNLIRLGIHLPTHQRRLK